MYPTALGECSKFKLDKHPTPSPTIWEPSSQTILSLKLVSKPNWKQLCVFLLSLLLFIKTEETGLLRYGHTEGDFHSLNVPKKLRQEKEYEYLDELSYYIFECQATEFFVVFKSLYNELGHLGNTLS